MPGIAASVETTSSIRRAPRASRERDDGSRPAATGLGPVLFLFLRLGIGAFLGQQRLPVGDRDLVVVGMDFRKRQESVAVAAVVDEGGLQRGLDAGDLRQIDIAG